MFLNSVGRARASVPEARELRLLSKTQPSALLPSIAIRSPARAVADRALQSQLRAALGLARESLLVRPATTLRFLTMAMTFDDVDAVARKLPGVTVGAKWGNRTWMVDGKGFAWHRPFSKADLKRFGDEAPPSGEILAVSVENLDAKDALLAIAPPGFFTIPHFNGYPAVLIALRQARAKDVRAAILDAFRAVAASLPIAKRAAPRARKPP